MDRRAGYPEDRTETNMVKYGEVELEIVWAKKMKMEGG